MPRLLQFESFFVVLQGIPYRFLYQQKERWTEDTGGRSTEPETTIKRMSVDAMN